MSRGVVLFGINNARINYVQLAIMAKSFIKRNMPGTKVCLITDTDSLCANLSATDEFDDVKTIYDAKELFYNRRTFKDTHYHEVLDRFRNETRSLVYDLSPYDETLLVDCDYLVANNSLSAVWGSQEDVLINKSATSLLHKPLQGPEYRLSPYSIRMYWATVIYFKKSKKAELLFNLVQYIKEHWEYYRALYDFPGNLFRNDYAFSIAIHILNGFSETEEFAPSLPIPSIVSALDTDQFYKINAPDDFTFYANDPAENWKFYLTRLKGVNVHCMNKISLLNNMNSIMRTIA